VFWENFQSYENVDSHSAVAEDASVLQYDTVSLGEWFPTFHFEIHADQQVSCTAGLLQMKIKQCSAIMTHRPNNTVSCPRRSETSSFDQF